MELADLPGTAGWVHEGARAGFEVLFVSRLGSGRLLRGHTTAVEDGVAWSVGYRIELDDRWRTLRVEARTATAAGDGRRTLERDGDDRWTVDGAPRPELDGCVDVDFESSAVTNTLPVHRLALRPGERRSVPAAFVRADDLRVERLEQDYALRGRDADRIEVDYASSTFDFSCTLTYDASGLIVAYPGIARRAGA